MTVSGLPCLCDLPSGTGGAGEAMASRSCTVFCLHWSQFIWNNKSCFSNSSKSRRLPDPRNSSHIYEHLRASTLDELGRSSSQRLHDLSPSFDADSFSTGKFDPPLPVM